MRRASLLFVLILFSGLHTTIYAWNDTLTHPNITRLAIGSSIIDEYFRNTLFLKKGIQTQFGNTGNQTVAYWIMYGAEKEDDPMCRASNHFHNPYNYAPDYWLDAGLSDTHWFMRFKCMNDYPVNDIRSNLVWGTGCLNRECDEQGRDEDSLGKNDYDWSSARESFYTYLTGKDAFGYLIAPEQDSRNRYLAESLRAVGQVMHLLQDSAVPAHVRNDFYQGHLMILPNWEVFSQDPNNANKENLIEKIKNNWIGNDFEKYVERHNDRWWFLTPIPIRSGFTDIWITDLWDSDQLNEGYAPISGMGLTEYTSMNFLSENSSFKPEFAFPNKDHCVVTTKTPPANTGTILPRKYVSTTTDHPGEQIEHLSVVSYLKYFRDIYVDFITPGDIILNRNSDQYYMDENCYEEYAEKLIPRAIGYSADLLDYFFRGKLQIRKPFVKIVSDGSNLYIKGFEFEAKNISTISGVQEFLFDGDFELIYSYLPEVSEDQEDEESDPQRIYGRIGAERLFSKDSQDPYNIIGSDDPINLEYVRLTAEIEEDSNDPTINYIPIGCKDISIMLVYKGTLGHEHNIAIAVGSHRFDEASLASNTRWLFDHQLISGLNPEDPIPGETYPINIHTVLPDGDDMRNLTNVDTTPVSSGPYEAYFQPAWSPDGRMIAYRENYCSPGARVELDETPWFGCEDYTQDNPPHQFIYIADLTEDQFDPANPMATFAWPADYYPNDPPVGSPSSLYQPSFSPDNQHLLCVIRHNYDDWQNLVVFDIEDGAGAYVGGYDDNVENIRYFHGSMWKKTISYSRPQWSPDGERIAYYVNRLIILEDPEDYSSMVGYAYPADIYGISSTLSRGEGNELIADSNNDTALTTDSYINTMPSWSPDSQWIVFSSNRGPEVGDPPSDSMDLWIMDRNGQNTRKIFDGKFGEVDHDCKFASFSPDGMRLVFLEGGAICTVGIGGQDARIVIDANSMSGTEGNTVRDFLNHLSWSPYLDEYLPAVTLTATDIDGDSIELTWTSTDADRVVIDNGVGEVEELSGSIEVTATSDIISFTATAYNWAGRATAIVNITVD